MSDDPVFPATSATLRRGSIALVIRSLVGHSGGAERLFCELANMLDAAGYAVTCFHDDPVDGPPFYPLNATVTRVNLATPRAGTLTGRPFRRVARRLLAGVSRLPIGDAARQKLWHAAHGRFTERLRAHFMAERPGLAISFLPPANTPVLAAIEGLDQPVIVTNHNVPEQDFDNPDRWDPNPWDRQLRKSLLKRATAIHILSREFLPWFPSELRNKVVVVPNYVSNALVAGTAPQTRQNIILAVGRLSPTKNYGVLIASFALLARDFPDWQVHIHGTGDNRTRLERLIAGLGLESSVLLKGQTRDIGPEYARAAILCHPALYEGFGLSAAESLAFGTPVVAFSDCAGLTEYVVDGQNGLLVDRAGGPVALAAALRRLMEDAALRDRLSTNGPLSVTSYSESSYRTTWLGLVERSLR